MVRTLLRIAVAVTALALVASRVDLHAVVGALGRVSAGAIVLATAASFVANLVIAYRLRIMLAAQGVATDVGQTFAVNLSAFFYNLFLPVGGVGVAAIRLQRLSRHAGGRYAAALTAIVCDRLAAIGGLALIGLVCWLLDPGAKPAAGLLILLGGTTALGLMLAPRAVPAEVRRFVRELAEGGGGTWWAAVLLRLANALGSVARLAPRTLAVVLAISVAAQLPGIVLFAVLADGLGCALPYVAMGWVRSVVVLITILPISIAGVGVREGALVLMLQPFGVAPADALALSILVFATTILAPGLAGGLVEGALWLRAGRAGRGDRVR